MSLDCQPSAATPAAARDAPVPPGRRRLDRIDEPAQTLGAKRAALQLRRQCNGATRAAGQRQTFATDALFLASTDGSVELLLRASPGGLLVQRTQPQPAGARLVQCMVFRELGGFDRWCESEPMRFEDPVLYDRLRRQGHEALDGKR